MARPGRTLKDSGSGGGGGCRGAAFAGTRPREPGPAPFIGFRAKGLGFRV